MMNQFLVSLMQAFVPTWDYLFNAICGRQLFR
jgi:hypothetical protein